MMYAEETAVNKVNETDDGVEMSTVEIQNSEERGIKKEEIRGDFLDVFKFNGKLPNAYPIQVQRSQRSDRDWKDLSK